MPIIKSDAQLSNALERMLQGLAFWMGYSKCMNVLYEHDCVHEAFSILSVHLDKSKYAIEYEFPYSAIDSRITSQERADLVILKKTPKKRKPICALEFKMSTNSNGGVEGDIEKLQRISKNNILRFVILMVYEDTPKVVSQFTDGEKNFLSAKRGNLTLKKGCKVRVRRVAKAMSTADKPKRNPYMAICIEPCV